jgi:sterol desaturase/sphingolipid hydroxylase (fatty acid hydroxylase superfamily)
MKGADNFVSAANESPKMFENKLLDFFSRTHPAMVLMVYLPLISYFFYSALITNSLPLLTFVGLFASALFIWSFFEYYLHRYAFHFQHDSKIGRRVHFMIHGCHHDFPNDAGRLVMPIVPSGLLALLMYGIFYFFIIVLFNGGVGHLHAFFASFVLGYVIYDMMHYASHYAKWKFNWFKEIQRNHMDHHYVDNHKGYGLSNVFWDRIFGTEQDSIKKKKK